MNSTTQKSQVGDARLPPSSEWTDEQLLVHYQRHEDARAFEELVRRYERELYTYLRRYLGNDESAEDVFQATFLQVHLKCDQFEPGRRVRPWLYTVATNQAIDSQRRNRRHRMVSLDRRSAGNGDQDLAALIDLLDSGGPTPAEQYESVERAETVTQAVEQLPDPLREVVLLVYYQGLKYREAAEVLCIPVGTVKSRLHCAVYRLNESLTNPSSSTAEDD
jgi:RNA polymerase sigma-70 factor (ECF subfamily)